MSQSATKSVSLPMEDFKYLFDIMQANNLGFSDAVSLTIYKAQLYEKAIENIGMLVDSNQFKPAQLALVQELLGISAKPDIVTPEGN